MEIRKKYKIRLAILLLIWTVILIVLTVNNTYGAEPVPTPTEPTSPVPTVAPAATNNDGHISGLASSTVLLVSLANLDPNPAVAGDTVEVRIGIENTGGTSINNLITEIVPEYPFELVAGEKAVKDVGIVEGYRTDSTANIKIVKYKMKINKDASAGSYELKIKYYEKLSKDVTVKILHIDVKSMANVEVIHIDKTTLVPGKQGGLKFTINNVGNAPLRDITFNWENKDNVILPVGSDNTRHVKYIGINESFDLEYQVIADTNANPGLYKLNLYLTYTDSINGTSKLLSSIAGVYVGGGTDFDISFSENSDSDTSFNIANIGSNPAYAVLIIIPNQNSWKVKGSNSAMIGNLNSGDYTVASFKLMTSGISNSSSMQMQIAYTDTMGERKIIGKEVELDSQNIVTDNREKISQEQRGDPINIVIGIIAGIIILVFLASTYRKYKKQKLIDPDLNIMDIFRKRKKYFRETR